MKKILIFICMLLITQEIFAQSETLNRVLRNDSSQKYLIQLPRQYTAERAFPILVAIHWYSGTAEQQINEWRFLAQKDSYILICPQFYEGYQRLAGSEDQKLIAIIDEVSSEFSVDRENIYLVGFSGGAQFALRFVYKHPFLKAVCILSPGEFDSPPKNEQLKSVKYFLGVGEKDSRLSIVKKLYNVLDKRGFDVSFESYPLVGHNIHSNMKSAVMKFLHDIHSP
ncbi:MAG: dienelactone hydrolase family protein [Candidatus Omnitrophica bacterium]|nr:dienelactone hydrolase family protein [Candidatus Omnitrophota bacterium]